MFLGPNCVLTNDFNPRAAVRKPHAELWPTRIGRGATIGANATIVCGVTVGRSAFIGAGTVVIRDVPDFALMVGNPARQTGWMCACGTRLSLPVRAAKDESGICKGCGRTFKVTAEGLTETVGPIPNPTGGKMIPGSIRSNAAIPIRRPQTRVPFLDLKAQYQSIREEIDDALNRVLESAHYVGGECVEQFEEEFAAYVGARYAVALGSGTAALELVLRAYGIGQGDEVIVPANTFFATAEAVSSVGAIAGIRRCESGDTASGRGFRGEMHHRSHARHDPRAFAWARGGDERTGAVGRSATPDGD